MTSGKNHGIHNNWIIAENESFCNFHDFVLRLTISYKTNFLTAITQFY